MSNSNVSINLSDLPYNRNKQGITIHIPQSIIESEELNLSILQFQRIQNPKENTTQPFPEQSQHHHKLQTLLLSNNIENIVQAVDLMKTVDTSFGEILSIFNISLDIDSYDSMYRYLQTQMNDEESINYLSLYLSACCQSKNIFDSTSLNLSCHLFRKLPSNLSSFSKLQELTCSNSYDYVPTEKEWNGLLTKSSPL